MGNDRPNPGKLKFAKSEEARLWEREDLDLKHAISLEIREKFRLRVVPLPTHTTRARFVIKNTGNETLEFRVDGYYMDDKSLARVAKCAPGRKTQITFTSNHRIMLFWRQSPT